MCERIAKSKWKSHAQVREEGLSTNSNRSAGSSPLPIGKISNQSARLVIDADCTICGPIAGGASHGISIVRSALAHSATTKHVVILNGTTDVPEADQQHPLFP